MILKKYYNLRSDTMDIEYIIKNYIFENLSNNRDLNKFDCASKGLNKFLKVMR